jgi:hypothetical protein
MMYNRINVKYWNFQDERLILLQAPAGVYPFATLSSGLLHIFLLYLMFHVHQIYLCVSKLLALMMSIVVVELYCDLSTDKRAEIP